MFKRTRLLSVSILLTFALALSSCSESRTGPAWTCAPQVSDSTVKQEAGSTKPLCEIQVKGKDLLVRLANKKDKWYMFVSHPKGGQTKAKLTITPRWGSDVVIETKPETSDCSPKDCIFPLPADVFKKLQKSKKFSIKLTRTVIVPHNVSHKKFDEEFTNHGLTQALKDAGF